jgi:hypothetical protein
VRKPAQKDAAIESDREQSVRRAIEYAKVCLHKIHAFRDADAESKALRDRGLHMEARHWIKTQGLRHWIDKETGADCSATDSGAMTLWPEKDVLEYISSALRVAEKKSASWNATARTWIERLSDDELPPDLRGYLNNFLRSFQKAAEKRSPRGRGNPRTTAHSKLAIALVVVSVALAFGLDRTGAKTTRGGLQPAEGEPAGLKETTRPDESQVAASSKRHWGSWGCTFLRPLSKLTLPGLRNGSWSHSSKYSLSGKRTTHPQTLPRCGRK